MIWSIVGAILFVGSIIRHSNTMTIEYYYDDTRAIIETLLCSGYAAIGFLLFFYGLNK